MSGFVKEIVQNRVIMIVTSDQQHLIYLSKLLLTKC